MGGFNFQLCVPCPGPFLGLCLLVALRWSCFRYRLSLVDGVLAPFRMTLGSSQSGGPGRLQMLIFCTEMF